MSVGSALRCVRVRSCFPALKSRPSPRYLAPAVSHRLGMVFDPVTCVRVHDVAKEATADVRTMQRKHIARIQSMMRVELMDSLARGSPMSLLVAISGHRGACSLA